jgi:hypothetical protein
VKRWRRFVLFALAVACLAPTPGDIGSCGQEAQELDPALFFDTKRAIDCERCRDCGITTETCRRACDDPAPQAAFAEDCLPLVHDGEVCLRALLSASCSDYETFTRDVAPLVPAECDFCPPRVEP